MLKIELTESFNDDYFPSRSEKRKEEEEEVN